MVNPLVRNQIDDLLYGDARNMLNDMRQFPSIRPPSQGQQFVIDPNALSSFGNSAHNSLNPNNWKFQHDIRNSPNPKHENMWSRYGEPAWYRRNRQYYYEEERAKQAKAWQHIMNRNTEVPQSMQFQPQSEPWKGADSRSIFDNYANQRQQQGEMGRNFYEEYANAQLNDLRGVLATEPPGGPLLGMGNAGEAFAEGAMNGLLGTPISGPETSLGRVGLGGGGGGIGGPSFRGGGGPSVESPFITSLGDDVPRPELPKDLGGGGGNNGGGSGLWDGIKGMGADGWANVIGGVNALGNMYLGHQSLKLGKQRFNFEAGLARRNLANQAQMYNSAIERRARSNAASFGYEGQERDSYVDGIVDKEKVKGTI